jgi:succinate dehydrogenase / fumarate reductase membrane anchor subunit
MAGYRTSLGRARGLGAAGHGVGHWIGERVSSIALVPLGLWAVYSGLLLAAGDYAMAVRWLHSPLHAVLSALLIAVAFWHMHAGARVVVEDYIHTTLAKSVLLLLNLAVCVLGASLAIFCVLKVALLPGAA